MKDKQIYTHYSNSSFQKEYKQQQVTFKYITYQKIINNVILHCIELRNETNSTLSIENILNSFDKEMIKIRNEIQKAKTIALPINQMDFLQILLINMI